MTKKIASIRSVHIGRAVPFGKRGKTSAIDKGAADGRVFLSREGLEGDEQADRKNHGGRYMALHQYPGEHYAAWAAELPEQRTRFVPGGFGENLSTVGMDEHSVCVGDVYELGGAVVRLSQGRQPCWKLNLRFQVPDMAKRVQRTGRTGWYYEVIQPGYVEAGDGLVLSARPHPDWTVARLIQVLYVDRLNREALTELSALEDLSPSWRELFARRLTAREVESWHSRVETPDGD